MENEDLVSQRIKRSDCKILEDLKDHPRQPLHEIISEVVAIATKTKKKRG